MANIDRYSSSLPKKVGSDLTKLLFEDSYPESNCIELIISFKEKDINVKDLSSYLDLIYRIDGQLSKIGYTRYVQMPRIQIKITEFRIGSVEVSIERLINSLDFNNIAIIGLCLRYLPSVIKTFIEVGDKYYEMLNKREDYLEKNNKRKSKIGDNINDKSRRQIRKNIRNCITQDKHLPSINKKFKDSLVNLISNLFSKNLSKLNSSSRFANDAVNDIKISVKRKNN